MDGSFTAIINARIRQFQARMRTVRQEITRSAQDVEIDINANTNPISRAITRIRMRIAQLEADNSTITFQARIDKFQRTLGTLATNMRAFGEVAQTTISGAFLTLLPAVVPLIANIGVAIANLGPIIGVLGGQALGLAGAFGAAGAAGLAAMLLIAPAVAKLTEEYEDLNATQRRSKAVFGELKKEFNAIQKELEKPINNIIQNTLYGVITTMRELKPLFESSIGAVNRFVTAVNQNIKTPPVQELFKYLNENAAGFIDIFGRAAINVFNGLASIFVALAPLSLSVAKGFEAATKSFESWAVGLGKSEKFQAFISYTQENLPKLKAIFRDLGAGLVYFFAAFGTSSSGMLDGLVEMMARFKEFSSTLSQNQGFQTFLSYVSQTAPAVLSLIGQLTTFLVNLGISMAPVGASILVLVKDFLTFSNSILESNRWIGTIITSLVVLTGAFLTFAPSIIAARALFTGLGTSIISSVGKAIPFVTGLFTNLGGTITTLAAKFPLLVKAFTLLTGPVGIAIAAITAFIAILVKTYKENEEFRNKVDAAWNKIKEVIASVTSEISKFVSEMWEKITSFWTENQDSIKSATENFWKLIQKTVNIGMDLITAIFTAAWPIISNTVKVAWDLIKSIITIGIDLVLGIVKAAMQVLNGDWAGAWNTLVETGKKLFNTFIDFLKGIDLSAIGKEIINGLAKGIKKGYDVVKGAVTGLAKNITGWVKSSLDINSPSRVMEKLARWIPAGVAEGITGNLGVVKDATSVLADTMTTDLSASSLGLTTALNGGMDSKLLNSYELTSGQDQIGVLKQIASLISQLDFTVELDGEVISEKVDGNRGRKLSATRTILGV